MQKFPVRFRENAIQDLHDISSYIIESGGSRIIASGFVRRIKEKCIKIGDAPFGSVSREDLGTGIRLMAFERSAVIAYRIMDQVVEVVSVFYGGRDLEALMRGTTIE